MSNLLVKHGHTFSPAKLRYLSELLIGFTRAAFRALAGRTKILCEINRLTARPGNENISWPASYDYIPGGWCSRDVISLYDVVGRSAEVTIVDAPLYTMVRL